MLSVWEGVSQSHGVRQNQLSSPPCYKGQRDRTPALESLGHSLEPPLTTGLLNVLCCVCVCVCVCVCLCRYYIHGCIQCIWCECVGGLHVHVCDTHYTCEYSKQHVHVFVIQLFTLRNYS